MTPRLRTFALTTHVTTSVGWLGAVAGLGRRLSTRTPRWVFAFGVIVVVLVLLFLIKHLGGGGLAGHTM